MKKISEIFNVEILDDEYNNSNDFTYEKQVDQMRYIYNNLSLKYLFYKDYSKYFDVLRAHFSKLFPQETDISNAVCAFMSQLSLQRLYRMQREYPCFR